MKRYLLLLSYCCTFSFNDLLAQHHPFQNPPGVYVYWRDGFYVAVNYSSENYTMNMPETAKILVGEKILKPASVLVWKE
jgi:hypothetical protein